MKTRTKTPAHTLTPPAHRAAVEQYLGQMAGLTNAQRALTVLQDNQLQAIKDEYSPQIAEFGAQYDRYHTALQIWAETNPAEFGKLKSIELASGKLGFRTGTPKLKTLPKRTWDTVLETLKTLAGCAQFVRSKEEVAKDLIIAATGPAGTLDAVTLKRIGVELVQDETFFVEPKLSEVPIRQSTPVAEPA